MCILAIVHILATLQNLNAYHFWHFFFHQYNGWGEEILKLPNALVFVLGQFKQIHIRQFISWIDFVWCAAPSSWGATRLRKIICNTLCNVSYELSGASLKAPRLVFRSSWISFGLLNCSWSNTSYHPPRFPGCPRVAVKSYQISSLFPRHQKSLKLVPCLPKNHDKLTLESCDKLWSKLVCCSISFTDSLFFGAPIIRKRKPTNKHEQTGTCSGPRCPKSFQHRGAKCRKISCVPAPGIVPG